METVSLSANGAEKLAKMSCSSFACIGFAMGSHHDDGQMRSGTVLPCKTVGKLTAAGIRKMDSRIPQRLPVRLQSPLVGYI